MQVISRQQAISEQRARYYTGQPCKRGHYSERYTKMSACIACLHPSFDAQEIKARRDTRERLSAARSLLMRIRVRLHSADLQLFEAMALATAMAHEPLIQLRHIRTLNHPKWIGTDTRIYTFLCFQEDRAALYAFQDSLESARRPVVSLTSQDRLAAVLEAADADASQDWPEFKP